MPSEHPAPQSKPARPTAERVYDHLRAIARRQMMHERAGHTLTATALVNEAFLRLAHSGSPGISLADRREFYNAAAAAMRCILIDHARRRDAAKRGGGKRGRRLQDVKGALDLAEVADLSDVLALDQAISRLEEEDPRAAGVVRLRFYAGLTGEQASELLGISPRQVDREWAFARAFLLRQLRPEGTRDRTE